MSTDATAALSQERGPQGLSPPDSNSAQKDTGSDSELSDLEPDQPSNELLEIEPDHISEGGVPVFKPTMEEFKDFQRYMAAVNPYGMKSGIVKVIPPAEWVAAQPRLDEVIKTIRVKEPIKQDIMGTGGTYRQANFMHQRSYNLPQWRQLCDQSEHQPPAKRGERRANQEKYMKTASKPSPKPKAPNTPSTGGSQKRGRGRPFKNKPKVVVPDTETEGTPDRLPTPVSPSIKPEGDDASVKLEPEDDDTPSRAKGGRQPKAVSVSSRRKNNRRETGFVDEAAFKDFKYELEGEEYTQERTDDLERAYWKTLTYASPLYGADMPGTLFDDRTTTWNLGKLDNLLDIMGTKIPGVNTAYLYLGMWKATFAWHLEDVDLYSINYLHFGAPKQWYSIAQGDARRFEAAMKTIWPTDAKACDQFLRHKTFLISPAHLLANFNIKVNKIVSHPGEFVITFPYGYHSGYNLGYNCAEAVNFALESWLEYGRVAKKCDCSQAQDSVWIDVHALERKLRGEETEYEETDDEEEDDDEDDAKATDLPTPPESSGDTKMKAPPRKRKRPTTDSKDNVNTKRIRVRIKAPAREPCILCPNDIPSEPLLYTEDGQKAHRICASYIPETSISTKDNKEIITDVKYIDKARLELKCNYCRSRKGACFQCSRKKCTRAYHATCAAAAGVLVEQGEIPVFGEDGTEYKDWGIEFNCRFHRSKRDKKVDGDTLGEDKRILAAALELRPGQVCQMQYFRGDIFAGAVVENRKSEQMILVDILPRGECLEVEYKWLLIPDPSDYHLPKPSAKAIPMPKSFKDKESLNTSKRQVDDIPRAEDPFVKGCTWAEFKCEAIPRNAFQVKVDFKKENQVWYYLGKNSTEAKAQFTEDLANPRHNPKGLFLETLPKAFPAAPRQSYAASYPASLSQNALNASRAATKAPQPTFNQNRPEKPYVYKPRDNSAPYSIDPQAYRSQQSFLQRSTPAYSFGTDPRYRPETSSSNAYKITAPTSTVATSSALKYPPPRSNVPTYPSPADHRAYAAPKPAYTPTPPKPADSSQHRSQGVQSKVSTPKVPYTRPNSFAKYSYLQKEHNRSPWDYKSPYRPGGGFMNGYQGDIAKAVLHQYSQERMSRPSTESSSSPATAPSPASATYKYGTYGAQDTASSTSKQSPPPARTQWEQKDKAPLHPAIRPEYNSMFHNKYQPQPGNQYRGPTMQPPAMYDRTSAQLQPGHQPYVYQSPQLQTHHHGPPLQASHPSTQNMTPPVAQHPPPPSYQYQQNAAAPQQRESPVSKPYSPSPTTTQPSTSYNSQQYSSNPAQYQENKGLYPHQQYFQKPQNSSPVQQQLPPQTQYQGYSQATQPASQTYQSHVQQQQVPQPTRQTYIPPPQQPQVSQPVSQAPQSQPQQQQYSQPVAQSSQSQSPHPQFSPPAGQSCQYQTHPPQVSQPGSQFQPRAFPDVPADSTSLVESMLANLRKAARTTAPTS